MSVSSLRVPKRAPAIRPAEFTRRRRQLMRRMSKEALVVLPSAPTATRSRDTEYPYRQDSDFAYLTAFPEPEAVLVLDPARRRTLLFCRPRNPAAEVWDGRRAGPEGAMADYGADTAWPIDELDTRMPELMAGKAAVWYPLGVSSAFDARVQDWLKAVRGQGRAGVRAPTALRDVREPLHEMRLHKSAAEIRMMRHAGRISAAAHAAAMRACVPGAHEYTLEAELWHTFVRHGSRFPAYPSIVGGGANACVLHYTENSAPLVDGDLVLIDAGCEFGGYAADITRTFPVNGRFSAPQCALYELVLKAQREAIRAIRPGVSWNRPHEITVRVLTRGLVDLGLLKGKVPDLIRAGAYRDFYMHRSGHWLGMDVHDVGDYRVNDRWRPLEPGMTFTVEPGLYIPPSYRQAPKRFRGLGVRIEDDVCVTDSGVEVLTDAVPKTPAAIEALMAGAP